MAWEYFKFFHILLALVFFSGIIVAMMSMSRAEKEPNLHTVRSLVRMANFAGPFLIDIPLILVGVFGVLTAWKQGLSLTDTGWLNAAYAATALGLIMGFFGMGRHARKCGKLVEEAVARGEKTVELQQALSSKVPKITGMLLHALLLYIIVLMVFKPF